MIHFAIFFDLFALIIIQFFVIKTIRSLIKAIQAQNSSINLLNKTIFTALGLENLEEGPK